MNKKQRVIWAIVLVGQCVTSVTGLCVAWFSASTQVNNGVGGIVAASGVKTRIKYFTSDSAGTSITKYDSRDKATLLSGDVTYDTYFKEFTDTSRTLSMSDMYPYSMITFAIELYDGNPSSTYNFYMANYKSNDMYAYDSSGTASSKYRVNLANASVFNFASCSTSEVTTTATSFVKTPDETTNIKNYTNFFSSNFDISTSYEPGSTSLNVYSLKTGSTGSMYSVTLDSDGTKVVFMSLLFSNESSTFFSYNSTGGYWYQDSTTGNSNIYQSLSIEFGTILIDL
jgi:hypothetical protein